MHLTELNESYEQQEQKNKKYFDDLKQRVLNTPFDKLSHEDYMGAIDLEVHRKDTVVYGIPIRYFDKPTPQPEKFIVSKDQALRNDDDKEWLRARDENGEETYVRRPVFFHKEMAMKYAKTKAMLRNIINEDRAKRAIDRSLAQVKQKNPPGS